MVFNIIGLACVGVIWIASEPTIRLRRWLVKENTMLFRLLECTMCSSWHIYFWHQLFTHQTIDILGASICAIISEYIINKLNSGSI